MSPNCHCVVSGDRVLTSECIKEHFLLNWFIVLIQAVFMLNFSNNFGNIFGLIISLANVLLM